MRGAHWPWWLDVGLLAANLVLFALIRAADGKLSPIVTLIERDHRQGAERARHRPRE